MNVRVAVALALPLLALAVACRSGTEPDPSGPIAKGRTAPSFDLPSATGQRVAFSDFVGHRPILLYFSMGPG